MKQASTMWTTVARAPLAEREGRARAVLRARGTSHNVSSRRLQSAPKARQIEAAAKEHLAPLPRAARVASRQERAMNPVEIAALDALDLLVVVGNESDTLSSVDKGVPQRSVSS